MDKFDGYNVDHFAGRFSGAFPTDDAYPMDSEVTFLVVGRVRSAAVKAGKNGDLTRVDTFELLEVSPTGVTPKGRRIQQAQASVVSQLELGDDPNYEELHLGGDEKETVKSSFILPEGGPVLHSGSKESLFDEDGWS